MLFSFHTRFPAWISLTHLMLVTCTVVLLCSAVTAFLWAGTQKKTLWKQSSFLGTCSAFFFFFFSTWVNIASWLFLGSSYWQPDGLCHMLRIICLLGQDLFCHFGAIVPPSDEGFIPASLRPSLFLPTFLPSQPQDNNHISIIKWAAECWGTYFWTQWGHSFTQAINFTLWGFFFSDVFL